MGSTTFNEHQKTAVGKRLPDGWLVKARHFDGGFYLVMEEHPKGRWHQLCVCPVKENRIEREVARGTFEEMKALFLSHRDHIQPLYDRALREGRVEGESPAGSLHETDALTAGSFDTHTVYVEESAQLDGVSRIGGMNDALVQLYRDYFAERYLPTVGIHVSFNQIVPCGVVDEEAYRALPRRRCVFILDEPYSLGGEEYSWPEALREETDGARTRGHVYWGDSKWGAMAWQMARLVRVVNDDSPTAWYWPGQDLIRYVWPIAMTNAKKTPNTQIESSGLVVSHGWVRDTWDLLMAELRILAPDVVFGCGRNVHNAFANRLRVHRSLAPSEQSNLPLQLKEINIAGRLLPFVEVYHPSRGKKRESMLFVLGLRNADLV